jgi:hypothetical protein
MKTTLMRYSLFGLALVLAMVAGGCGGGFPSSSRTDDGRYEVEIVSVPDPLPFNELFGFSFLVKEMPEGVPANPLVVTINADMPGHNHGMNTRPEVVETGKPGEYRVEGMLLHMAGVWDILVQLHGVHEVSTAKFRIKI